MSIDHLEPLQKISRWNVLRRDFHLHTAWTDGAQSVKEMHESAIMGGLECILFSEHVRKTSGDWFPRFAEEVRDLPRDLCWALVGLEAKVENFDGEIDTVPDILAEADLVMASVHRFPGEQGIVHGTQGYTPERVIDLEFRLAYAALDNPHVDILGHPFGMCYRRFKIHPPERKMGELIAKAAKTGVAIEINSYYHPDPWQMIEWCQCAGARISLGSNAHSIEEVGRIIRILEGKEPAWIPFES
jgi:histidinol phosphatase-like PHP family hydrolase